MADDDFENRDFSPEAAVEPRGPDTEYGREHVSPFHGFGNDPQDQIIQELERRIRELEEKMTPLQRIETSAGGEADYEDDRVVIDVDEQEDEENPSGSGENTPPALHIGALTVTTEPFPSESDMTSSIESAISGNSPKEGDMIGLTRSGKIVFYFQLFESSGAGDDTGLFSRSVSEDGTDYRAAGWQTGAYA